MNKKTQRRESFSGYHFYNLYQNCQFKFLIRYYLKILPYYTAMPLINGSAFHEGKATFYLTKSKKKAIEKCKSEITDRRDEFEFEDDYKSVYYRCPILLDYWIDKYGYEDLELYKPIAVEKEMTFKLGYGSKAFITMRPDTVLESKKTGRLFGMETKTSGFSKKLAILGVENGEQATTYWIGLHDNMKGHKIEGIIADIAYWNKGSEDESNIDCIRSEIITRTDRDYKQYKMSTAQLFYEMSAKVQAVQAGHDPYIYFKRNTHYCNSFFKPCEYLEICRRHDLFTDFKPKKHHGLKRDRGNPLKTFSSYAATIDSIT